MEDLQKHHASLDDAKTLENMDAESHSEGSQNVKHQDHRVKDLKVRLKHLVFQ